MTTAGTDDPNSVTALEAIAEATAQRAVLVDVREQHEWDLGHSPLATLVPVSQLQARIDELPLGRRLLVVCHSGQRSARVQAALVGIGYDAVNVSGGMIAWQLAGGEIVAEGPGPARVD
ncbi:rhodanese-related sulfurtransferase [Marisediminicola sp. UYEF4]|uniref:rhodanese-like domain-containing protein n=1 Tax=Marisediminicola sp. UYEF4 TaxID=1756384 RepID=UPI003396832C